MQHIKKALKSYVQKNGLRDGLDEQKAIGIWSKTVGKKISLNTTPKSISRGVLLVEVTSPAWRQELQFQKKTIIKKINTALTKKSIKDIRFL